VRGDLGRQRDSETFYPFEMPFIGKVAARIVNQVRDSTRVV
jgi:hypothetical protein